MIKRTEEIKIEYDRLQKRFVDIHFNKETNFTDSNKFFELKNKKWIGIGDLKKAIENLPKEVIGIEDKMISSNKLLKELGLD